MHLNHPETILSTACPWKSCLFTKPVLGAKRVEDPCIIGLVRLRVTFSNVFVACSQCLQRPQTLRTSPGAGKEKALVGPVATGGRPGHVTHCPIPEWLHTPLEVRLLCGWGVFQQPAWVCSSLEPFEAVPTALRLKCDQPPTSGADTALMDVRKPPSSPIRVNPLPGQMTSNAFHPTPLPRKPAQENLWVKSLPFLLEEFLLGKSVDKFVIPRIC